MLPKPHPVRKVSTSPISETDSPYELQAVNASESLGRKSVKLIPIVIVEAGHEVVIIFVIIIVNLSRIHNRNCSR
ncbi:uncharacterized protein BDZ99DRAFT_457965 [Mytilinidion resinicola]|uniref:Uncharacterized protein n=1 Tax=Mytilinidion resinicola TaxID=574789 RepID=A0A6A6Z6X5_9PEZI|nr:uncharacterized protein BDZ99DRAFT_457965 [Mytilinidion resinicola]KAF2816054.1 hypothetical protein BDZ99DRAFT_457965 [Mytilinidion resinicola]